MVVVIVVRVDIGNGSGMIAAEWNLADQPKSPCEADVEVVDVAVVSDLHVGKVML